MECRAFNRFLHLIFTNRAPWSCFFVPRFVYCSMSLSLLIVCVAFATLHNADGLSMQKKEYTYLALGDSYTIGEGVPGQDNFPNQTSKLLSERGIAVSSPAVIAKTGWTSGELQDEINRRKDELATYDIVSLLIGVNNQYRGGSPDVYRHEFEMLLQQAVGFARNKSSHVFVLSIPDWGVTPYAENRDRKRISREIDSFNQINKEISLKWNVNYLEITEGSRAAFGDASLIASDGLHPSAKEYARWAAKLASAIQQQLQ